VVGEIRAGARDGIDAFRVALRRLFAGFELLGGARPFGKGLRDADSVGWPHDALNLDDGLYLYPHIRDDVIKDWGDDGVFPTLRRVALSLLSEPNSKRLQT
jgi:hypothetical protein